MSMDCGRRAFEAGLRWCNIHDLVPQLLTDIDIQQLSDFYGLQYYDDAAKNLHPGNSPILVIYEDNYIATSSKYHAVFASDAAPFKKWKIFAVVLGWERLRELSSNSNVDTV